MPALFLPANFCDEHFGRVGNGSYYCAEGRRAHQSFGTTLGDRGLGRGVVSCIPGTARETGLPPGNLRLGNRSQAGPGAVRCAFLSVGCCSIAELATGCLVVAGAVRGRGSWRSPCWRIVHCSPAV